MHPQVQFKTLIFSKRDKQISRAYKIRCLELNSKWINSDPNKQKYLSNKTKKCLGKNLKES